MPQPKNSQIQAAVNYLLSEPDKKLSAQTLKTLLGLNLLESTLSRKLRLKASQGIISKSYKRIDSGEEIAVYSAPEPPLGNNGDELSNLNPEQEKDESPENEHKPELSQGALF